MQKKMPVQKKLGRLLPKLTLLNLLKAVNLVNFFFKELENNPFLDTNTDKFDAGFKRKVGSMGDQLSKSQKQRISIARTLLKNPSVLILDGITTNLEDENEKAVQKALDQILEGKTSIFTTDEISTVKDVDEIIIFSGGKVLKRGSYEELVDKK